MEDKIVQQAVVTVLSAIYEVDFLGFSYGFRPGRGQHNALDALAAGIKSRKVNWVVDADIRSFFDEIDHGWMLRFLEHRIADQRIIRLIRTWLEVPIVGKWLQRVLKGYFAYHAVPTNLLRLNGSAVRSAAHGGMPCCAEVNDTGSTGLVSIASPVGTSRMPGSASLSGGALLGVTTLGKSRMR
jgi:hypothetical protein